MPIPKIEHSRANKRMIAFKRFFGKLIRNPETAVTRVDKQYMSIAFKAGADWEKNRIKPRNF